MGKDLATNESPCIEWKGPRTKAGYGRVGKYYAHRIAHAMYCGPIPPWMEVCHRCDNPACFNHKHLFLGTHHQNMADMAQKKRSCRGEKRSELMKKIAARGENHGFRKHPELCARGEKSGHAKLTETAVREIRAARATGISQRILGEKYGVSQATIADLLLRKTWRHVQ